ncbi:hypothetical protein OG21DRAFT_1487829 [Imleria badia]|nr:hypothetical protein OG21DRAFT_1487829 [Imleria badia]
MASDNINGCPKWAMIPSARLWDTENAAMPELHSHQAIKSSPLEAGGSAAEESPSDKDSCHPSESPSRPSLPFSSGGQKCKRSKGKRAATSVNNDALAQQSEAVASNGLLADIQVMDIDDPQKILVAEISTLQHHLQSYHRAEYVKWAKDNDFTSMLLNDQKSQKEDLQPARQTQLDGHLQPSTPKYSNKRFHAAPISALKHPSFKKVIEVAVQATNGVKIPSCKYTQTLIIDTFKENMLKLCLQLLSNAVKGRINLTCNAWQVSNTDTYFAVTGSWTQESSPGMWEVKTALLGFMQVNTHIVNLATQVLLRAYSHSKEYDPKHPEEDLIAWRGGSRQDEVGVVRSICVKERSSAKRKQLFQTIQQQAKPNHPPREHPLQLVLNMPIRWSSMYLMLDRCEKLKDDVDTFVHKIAGAEKDREKHAKL